MLVTVLAKINPGRDEVIPKLKLTAEAFQISSPLIKSCQSNSPQLQIFWWRRGRVELPVQKQVARIYYRLSQLFYVAWLTSADRV